MLKPYRPLDRALYLRFGCKSSKTRYRHSRDLDRTAETLPPGAVPEPFLTYQYKVGIRDDSSAFCDTTDNTV